VVNAWRDKPIAGSEGGGEEMFDSHGMTAQVDLVIGIARVLREEFGVTIDAQPGGAGNQAGTINRAFLATTRKILGAIVPAGELPGLTTWVLRQAAHTRLSEFGINNAKTGELLDSEPGLGDPWLVYLALCPDSVIEDLLKAG
jgi:hypothetical protein